MENHATAGSPGQAHQAGSLRPVSKNMKFAKLTLQRHDTDEIFHAFYRVKATNKTDGCATLFQRCSGQPLLGRLENNSTSTALGMTTSLSIGMSAERRRFLHN